MRLSNRRKLQKFDRQRRVEQLFLRGVTGTADIAIALGCSQPTISTDLREIFARWREEDSIDFPVKRQKRIKQFETLGRLAIEAFEQSKNITEEYREKKVTCEVCNGTKKEEHLPGKYIPCEECDAVGWYIVEEREVVGQSGDASFLRAAKECFAEAARLEGAGASQMTAKFGLRTAKGIEGGEFEEKFIEVNSENAEDLVIQSVVLMAELKKSFEEGEMRVVETEAKRIE